MADMTLDTLRIGERPEVIVLVTDSDDPSAEVTYSNEDFSITAGGHVTILSELGTHAELEAISPGTETLTFSIDDRFGDPQSAQRVITVIDTTSATFRTDGTFNNGTLVISDSGDDDVVVTAIPGDIRGENPPTYSVTDILWTSANGKVEFDTGGGPSPTGTGTLSLTFVAVGVGEDIVTLSFKNSLLATITATIPVRVIGANSFEFTLYA